MSENLSDMQISELICTRISHDIIGNVGAVSNAVELLEEGDLDFIDDIKSILKNSSFILSSRMKFFRMVFGLTNANLDNLDLIKKTAADYLSTICNNNNIDFTLSLEDAKFSRMAMLSAMIVADTFVRGGSLSIKQDGDKLLVSSDNNSMIKDKIFIIKEVINGKIPDVLAQYAPIIYLKRILKDTKYKLSVCQSEKLDFIIE